MVHLLLLQSDNEIKVSIHAFIYLFTQSLIKLKDHCQAMIAKHAGNTCHLTYMNSELLLLSRETIIPLTHTSLYGPQA